LTREQPNGLSHSSTGLLDLFFNQLWTFTTGSWAPIAIRASKIINFAFEMLRRVSVRIKRPFSSSSSWWPSPGVKVPLPVVPAGELPWNADIANAVLRDPEFTPGLWTRLSESVTGGLQHVLFEPLHDAVGLPWWLSIIGGTLCMRLVMLPAKLASTRNSQRMQQANAEFATRLAPVLRRRVDYDDKKYKQLVFIVLIDYCNVHYMMYFGRLKRNWPGCFDNGASASRRCYCRWR
jgi:hypothetical protein